MTANLDASWAQDIPADAVIVDNTILSTVAKCDTLAYVIHGLDVVPRAQDLALEAGKAAHAGLATWMVGGMDRDAVPKAMAAIKAAYEPAVAAYEARVEKAVPEGDRFYPPWVYAVMRQWFMEYSGKFPFKLVGDVVERPVVASLGTLKDERPLVMAARLDARVRKFASGGRFNLDHKTTRKVTDWWKDKQKVSSQFSGQLWIAEHQGERLEGVVLNVIEIPEKHKSDAVCKLHKVSYQECSIRHAGWDFVIITPHRNEVVQWERAARHLAERYMRLKRKAEREGWDGIPSVRMQGRFNESCIFCPLRQWCWDGRPTKRANVKALFRHRVWNPLDVNIT
jgi:PD-(D/E)XK nuclease superfamily